MHEKIDLVKNYEYTRDFIFIKNFRHPPKMDAVFYLCNEIFPLIKNLKNVKLFVWNNDP